MNDTARIILVRHGRVANPNHVVYSDLPGFDLDSVGVLQAHATAHYLRAKRVERIVSSPLERAQSTAAAIARTTGAPIALDNRCTEWQLSRAWKGVRWDDLVTERPGELEAYLAAPDSLPYAEESLAEVGARMRAALGDALATKRQGIVVVSHQDPVSALILGLLGLPLADLLVDPPSHASATTLVYDGQSWSLEDRWSPEV